MPSREEEQVKFIDNATTCDSSPCTIINDALAGRGAAVRGNVSAGRGPK
ncbi:hypothetical protein KCP75_07405 [Salmonella enterica subsp. enterica]|nr:hypothetical protein KCP75_07405 [Salmonella enterica subsp. enterica]